MFLCFPLDQDLCHHISCLKFFPFNFVSRMQCILHTKNVLKPWNEKQIQYVKWNWKKVDVKQVYWIKSRISYLIRWYKLQLSLDFFFLLKQTYLRTLPSTTLQYIIISMWSMELYVPYNSIGYQIYCKYSHFIMSRHSTIGTTNKFVFEWW